MDLLLTPPNPSLPQQKARYVRQQMWDGGPFFAYARRQGRMKTVPERLRQYITPSADDDGEFMEHLYPTPRDEQEAFMQTWLFFGLLAEFFGLNEDETGGRIVDVDTARVDIDAIYRDYIEEEDGVEYLTGRNMLLPQTSILIMKRLRLATPSIEDRIRYLRQCLSFSCLFLNTAIHTEFDPAIKTSIFALGELLSTGFITATTLNIIPNAQVIFSFPWSNNYLKDSGDLERQMLENGWCKSEVERVRSVNQGLGTLHFLSQMRKGGPRRDHKACTRAGCVALQIDAETYRPSHVRDRCGCKLKFVDEIDVQRILKETTTFPLLRVEVASNSDDAADFPLEMELEPYTEGVPYVAISHVWADGMGNPTANALPACQIAKVARLVHELEQKVNRAKGAASAKDSNYRIWIDPLLCPIESEGKKLALQRIPDVYRNATHVLVLDASLMEYTVDTLSPAEMLLRIFSSSAWMRRLWTLQEGALAQSLYFQFSDQPIPLMEHITTFFQKGVTDARYMRIWIDMNNEAHHLRGWFSSVNSTSSGSGGPAVHGLVSLQRTLHFRTVSDPADEPLCIATLMGLNLEYVVAVSEAQERMVRVWELIAKKLGGTLPARMLFSADATLHVPGWRWAPRSLLGASHAGGDSMMDANFRMMRFAPWKSNQSEPNVEEGPKGVPTPWGLRVQMGGYVLRSVPLLPGLPLRPWERVARSREDLVMVKHVPSGRWLHLLDFYRSEKSKTWTPEERRLYDREADNLLDRLISDGRRAIVRDPEAAKGGLHFCLMVRMEDGWDHAAGAGGDGERRQTVRARRERALFVDWASPAQSIVADGLQELAMKVAANEVTRHMLQEIDKVQDWDDGRETIGKVEDYMKKVMAEKWASDPTFVQAVHDTMGPDMENFMWTAIQMRFSHNVVCEDIPETQVWLID